MLQAAASALLYSDRLGDREAVIDHDALEVADLEHATHALAVETVPATTPVGRMHVTRADTSAGTSWQLLEVAGGPWTCLDVSTDLPVQGG